MSGTQQNRVAIVTGGNRGIGEAIARRLSAEGATVVLTHNRAESAEQAERLAHELGAPQGKALALQLDIADPDEIVAVVDGVVKQFGRLDILVSNAAIGNNTLAADITLTELDKAIAVNLRAPFIAAQAAARHMMQGGRIISIGTTNAVRVPRQSRVAYATTKSALVGMTKAMAHDYAEQGITVNLINPGPTRTGMLGDDNSPAVQQMLSFCAIKKLAMPQDIAGLVEFVAREEAWFITGAVLAIDGGYTA
ncbi:SDR family NAD(P)-dependent oxidoreductase [Klebsiella sp. BIGb0407]|uniref:SDR family NAD(P)-dependent oxidoreductase n=1 Tax=Klebsiella sp. BIGb0407 TaxID=2940603 RepID=UPI00216A8FDB|nr:SDR family oxidoreductase [Klebsiella sp. BIGb0407]MCS3430122.1 3-oxoacyl-[acyl-carrier protein] reductase [Klebsiella sp. BIGb0407]